MMKLRVAPIVAIGVLVTACDDSSAIKESGTSSSSSSTSSTSSSGSPAAPDSGTKDCFENPKTHFELINACTDADRIDRKPTLTKLLVDGGLPPLQ